VTAETLNRDRLEGGSSRRRRRRSSNGHGLGLRRIDLFDEYYLLDKLEEKTNLVSR